MSQARLLTIVLSVVLMAWAVLTQHYSCSDIQHQPPANQCYTENRPTCGFCCHHIDITIIIRNELVDDKFEHNITINNYPQRELIFFLEEAVNQNSVFKFESTYYAGLGYFIDSFNGLRGSYADKLFWHIIGVDGVGSLECGVSSFVPMDGDTILFNYTTWKAAGYDY